jgi:hypothetical protein
MGYEDFYSFFLIYCRLSFRSVIVFMITTYTGDAVNGGLPRAFRAGMLPNE